MRPAACSALHGFSRDEMFEARRALEVGVAGLAAERATDEQIATIAEEVTGMFASLDDAQTFLIHDIRFHRAIASSGAAIMTLRCCSMRRARMRR